MYVVKEKPTDSERVRTMKRYVAKTAMPKIPARSAESYEIGGLELAALAEMGAQDTNGLIDALTLALNYGQAKGLRMGRKEANQSRTT